MVVCRGPRCSLAQRDGVDRIGGDCASRRHWPRSEATSPLPRAARFIWCVRTRRGCLPIALASCSCGHRAVIGSPFVEQAVQGWRRRRLSRFM